MHQQRKYFLIKKIKAMVTIVPEELLISWSRQVAFEGQKPGEYSVRWGVVWTVIEWSVEASAKSFTNLFNEKITLLFFTLVHPVSFSFDAAAQDPKAKAILDR
jgi:hypothetical protein